MVFTEKTTKPRSVLLSLEKASSLGSLKVPLILVLEP
jgi:hypothetical protein